MKLFSIGAAVGALIAVVLALLLMRGCGKDTSLQQSKAAVDSATQADAAYHKALQSEIDRLTADSSTQQDAIDNLGRQNAWYEAQLSNTGQEITGTIKTYDSAVLIHDTILLVQTCDTLVDQVKAAKVEVHGFRLLSDSLVSALTDQGRIKDSTTRAFRSAFLHADSTGNFYLNQYNALYKKQKRAILTEKLAGGAAAALLLGLLIKK